MKDVLTVDHIRKAVEQLKENSFPKHGLYWVDNEYFYQSPQADVWGFRCTVQEIEKAKTHKDGFITEKNGVSLYLAMGLSAKEK